METGLISIIMPAYNVEEYIEKSLESVQKQSYKCIEIIVIDDCSSDGTVNIVHKLMGTDGRIKLLSTGTNSGSAFARQLGIESAQGEFITFVDSDDSYCDNEALSKMIKACRKSKADCVMWNYRTIHEKNIVIKKKFKGRLGMYTVKEAAESKACKNQPHWHYLWNKCYRAELLQTGNISFKQELRRAQDVRFNADFLRVAKSFYIIADYLYDYNCANINQITRKKVSPSFDLAIEQYHRLKEELLRLVDDYQEIDTSEKAIHALYEQFYKSVCGLRYNNSSLSWGKELCDLIEADETYITCREVISNEINRLNFKIKFNNATGKLKQAMKSLVKN